MDECVAVLLKYIFFVAATFLNGKSFIPVDGDRPAAAACTHHLFTHPANPSPSRHPQIKTNNFFQMTKLYWFALQIQQNMKNDQVNQCCFVTIIYSFNIKQSLLSESVQRKTKSFRIREHYPTHLVCTLAQRDLLLLEIPNTKTLKEYCVYLQQRHATTTNDGQQRRKSIQTVCVCVWTITFNSFVQWLWLLSHLAAVYEKQT